MDVAVGIDVAKESHWAVATRLDPQTGKAVSVLSLRVGNTPAAISVLIEQITELVGDGESLQVGIDMLGGIARLLEVMLMAADLDVVHVPGLAVKTARRATRGGEHKSDPRDARVIADQVRARDDLRRVTPLTDADADLAVLVSRRRELVIAQTRRITRLRDLLCSIHPGLERVVDPTNKLDLALLARYVTPSQIRRAGKTRIANYVRGTGQYARSALESLVDAAVAAAGQQRLSVPGENTAAAIVKDLAAEALTTRSKIAAIDAQLAEVLANHPDAALVATLPGMGAVLTAEFLAVAGGITRFPTGDHLAAAAALAPTLNQSGKPATYNDPSPATAPSNASSTNPRSALYDATRQAEPSTTANEAKAKPTTKPSSPWPDDASTSYTPCSATVSPIRPEPPKQLDSNIRLRPTGRAPSDTRPAGDTPGAVLGSSRAPRIG